MARPTKLDPDVQQRIVAYIRQGAYDWVAAQASGIDPSTFRRWMATGREGRAPYKAFFSAVNRARAEARVLAEIEVRRDDPFKWLRFGPGRERPGEPGWTDMNQLEVSGPDKGKIPLSAIDEIMADYDRSRLAES